MEQQKQTRKELEREAGLYPDALKTRMIDQNDSDGTTLHDSICAPRHAALGWSSGGDRHSTGGVGIIGDDDAAINAARECSTRNPSARGRRCVGCVDN
jgi:hypothetical protein